MNFRGSESVLDYADFSGFRGRDWKLLQKYSIEG